MKLFTNPLNDAQCEKLGEVIRFGIVGVAATVLQYVFYRLFLLPIPSAVSTVQLHLYSSIAMGAAYVLSFLFNFYASTHFTFKVKTNAKRGLGFAFSHGVNFSLQQLLLNFFLWTGMPEAWAPVPMFCICVPVNFLLVRFFLKR